MIFKSPFQPKPFCGSVITENCGLVKASWFVQVLLQSCGLVAVGEGMNGEESRLLLCCKINIHVLSRECLSTWYRWSSAGKVLAFSPCAGGVAFLRSQMVWGLEQSSSLAV